VDKSYYAENRRKLTAHLTENDAMLFFSGEPVRKSADESFPFFTNRNFLYLTGVKQEQSALLIQKRGDLLSECLLVLKPDLERESWTGRRLTDEEIHDMSGWVGHSRCGRIRTAHSRKHGVYRGCRTLRPRMRHRPAY